jgi:hypothetical protein
MKHLLKIKDISIERRDDVVKIDLSVNDWRDLLTRLLFLFEGAQYPSSNDIQILRDENELLKAVIKKMRFNQGLDKVLLGYHESNIASAAADLLINPNPRKIHSSEGGRGIEFRLMLMNILAIHSFGRNKLIYLREAIRPEDGGPKKKKIVIGDLESNFQNVLKRIQGGGHHLIMANRSTAVNIYHYCLIEKGHFILSIASPKGIEVKLLRIRTDSRFDEALYHQRLMEIDRLSKYHHDFSVNLKKIEEISRYKEKKVVT